MEKTVFWIRKYLWKLKIRAKQSDAFIVKKILSKEEISEDDLFIMKVIDDTIYFER